MIRSRRQGCQRSHPSFLICFTVGESVAYKSPMRLISLLCLVLIPSLLRAEEPRVEVPGVRPDGSILLPNQWVLRPVGKQVRVGDFPVNIALHPSGNWAAYYFGAYRGGMAPLMKGAPPQIKLAQGDDHITLHVAVDLAWLLRSPFGVGLKLGLSAVIEDRAQVLSYWALKHPTEKPDFHHADAFVIDLG